MTVFCGGGDATLLVFSLQALRVLGWLLLGGWCEAVALWWGG